MERAALYIRVSTDEQAKHGVSLDAQEERLRAYCTMRGLDLAAVVRDEGVSGFKRLADRPGGAELLQMIARREVSHVVVLKLDRAFRNAGDALTRTEEWDRSGVSLHLVDMGGTALDTGSATGRMMLTMLAGFAQFERDLISERTAAALAFKKSKGAVYCGETPLGYSRDGDQLVECPDELATVASIRTMRAEGASVRTIALRLNEAGIPSKRGGRWAASSVHYVLKNDLYSEVPA